MYDKIKTIMYVCKEMMAMNKKITIIIFCLIILSGCGDTTYNNHGSMTFDNSSDDHSKNTEGMTAVSNEMDIDTDIDKSTNNISEFSVTDSDEYKQLEKEKNELNNKIDELESQLSDMPVIEYRDLGLSMDGEDILLNRNNSMVIIDGREYISKEIIDSIISEDQNITIKNDTLYIGKVISDKANLFEQTIMDQRDMFMTDSVSDSYGNHYRNVLKSSTYCTGKKYVIYVLNREYSLVKFTVAVERYANIDSNGTLTIKADDNVVYAKTINKKTEPFSEIDIPIENCNLLSFEFDNDHNIDCIISNAIVYN